MTNKPTRYRALVGINYPHPKPGKPEIRVEAGEEAKLFPSSKVEALLAAGVLEEVTD